MSTWTLNYLEICNSCITDVHNRIYGQLLGILYYLDLHMYPMVKLSR